MYQVPELNAPRVPIKIRKTRIDLRGNHPSRKKDLQELIKSGKLKAPGCPDSKSTGSQAAECP